MLVFDFAEEDWRGSYGHAVRQRIEQALVACLWPIAIVFGDAERVEDFCGGVRQDWLGENAEQGHQIEARAHTDRGRINIGFVFYPWLGAGEVFIAKRPDGTGFGGRFAEFHFS